MFRMDKGNLSDTPTIAVSALETIIIPCAALLMTNIMLYAAVVSFALRPNLEVRLLPVLGLFFLGTWLGGAIFPRLSAWAMRTNSMARRLVLAAWLLTALATVLPGFHNYVFNEPLRYLANLTLGMAIAPAYQLFFSRFPQSLRGTFFGACLAAGLLCWSVLGSIAQAWPRSEDALFHPFLPAVFIIHTTAIVVLAALTIHAMVLRPHMVQEERPYFAPLPGKADRRKLIHTLLAAAFTIYLLSGLVGARLTPVFPNPSQQVVPMVMTIFAIFAAPAAGWLLDRRLEQLFRYVLPVCCGLFVLTPSLAALGYEHSLHLALQPVMAAAQFVLFVVCSVAVAGISPTTGMAVWYCCCIYGMRTVSALGHFIEAGMLALAPGTIVLLATLLAVLTGALLRRVEFFVDPCAEIPEEAPAAAQTNAQPQELDSLFTRHSLSPRERQVAALWLKGTSTRDMAAMLAISERTVKAHVKNILAKFGVVNRTAFFVKLLHNKDMDNAG